MTVTIGRRLTSFLWENRALIVILIGAALVSVSLGPYSNWDTETEYAAASSVVQTGFPYATPGNLINQPPIGFYINAFFLRIFGLSYATGVAAVTLFGVGCVFMTYMIGKTIYGSNVALVAAGLFALTPWQVVLSRSFLIDVPCLFFSLASLFVGILALRRTSLKLSLASGILFGVAFETKFFAVFTLIPIALLFVYYRPKTLLRAIGMATFFVLPVFFMHYLWYESISNLGFFSFLSHGDFLDTSQFAATPFFLLKFFIANPGFLFLFVIGISTLLSVWMRKAFSKTMFFDLVCLATIVGTAAVNMYLVLVKGLLVPYVDPIKYDYQLLPAICWLAASLLPKAYHFVQSASTELTGRKLAFTVALVGLILLAGAILLNLGTLQALTGQDYLVFNTEGNIGFSFSRLTPALGQPYLAPTQALGFILIIVSIFWTNKDKLSHIRVLNRFERIIKS